jgi:hypothetical protein
MRRSAALYAGWNRVTAEGEAQKATSLGCLALIAMIGIIGIVANGLGSRRGNELQSAKDFDLLVAVGQEARLATNKDPLLGSRTGILIERTESKKWDNALVFDDRNEIQRFLKNGKVIAVDAGTRLRVVQHFRMVKGEILDGPLVMNKAGYLGGVAYEVTILEGPHTGMRTPSFQRPRLPLSIRFSRRLCPSTPLGGVAVPNNDYSSN